MGKLIKDEDLRLNIIINGNQYKKELVELEDANRKLRQEQDKLLLQKKELKKSDSEYAAKLKALNEALDANKAAITANEQKQNELRQKIGLTGMTMKQLAAEAARLRIALSNATPGTENYKKLDTELQQILARQKELRSNSSRLGQAFDDLADKLNRYQTLMASVAAALYGVISVVKNFVSGMMQSADQMADVMKTTGLSLKQVKELKSEFKDLGTRTSNSDLMKLAETAGRLGKKSKEDILDFVQAANKIQLALGDDLGNAEEAILQTGKLAEVYKVAQRNGVSYGEAMIQIGSSLNTVSANSNAQAGYMIDFLKRMGGVSLQANITAQDIIGLGATLDNLGQQTETSSTAIGMFLVDMYKDTATYATIAGKSTKEFSELLKTDANEAFIQTLEGLNGNNAGFQLMVDKLNALGVDGSRGINVLSALSGNIKLLRQQQTLANDSLIKGTSVIDEYNIRNENTAAQLEKTKKKINELVFSLQEGLAPVVLAVNNAIIWFIENLEKISKAVGITAAAFLAYQLVVNGITYAKRVYIAVVQTAQKVQEMFNKSLTANTWGMLASAVTAAVAAYIMFRSEMNKTVVSIGEFNAELEKEKSQLNNVFDALKTTEEGTNARKEAVNKVNELYGKYLPNLLTEKSSLEEIEKAQRLATDALIRDIAVKSKAKDLEAATNDVLERQKKYREELIRMVAKSTDMETAGIFSAELGDLLNEMRNQGGLYNKQGSMNTDMDTKIRVLSIKYDLDYDKVMKNIQWLDLWSDQLNYDVQQIEAFYKTFTGTLNEVQTKTEDIQNKEGNSNVNENQNTTISQEKKEKEKTKKS